LEDKKIPRQTLRAGDKLELGPDLRLEVLHPPAAPQAGGGKSSRLHDNNSSLVLRLVWHEAPLALLCGDAELPAQRAILRALAPEEGASPALRAQVLVLPHHGSSGSSLPEFYQAVSPELALASCGFANPWGFPTPKTRQNLEEAGIPLLRTDLCGQIQARWTRPGPDEKPRLSVSTARAMP
ncbi:DNA internalization-related competence protein ComEC/Rec2, partial [Desulfovibrio sp. OttesenSCG-928-C14]|nr:DNA internalization-related competence protein ComEC/Rec2 [Desulfovibrio sp. OttesenSCG-928-C14]